MPLEAGRPRVMIRTVSDVHARTLRSPPGSIVVELSDREREVRARYSFDAVAELRLVEITLNGAPELSGTVLRTTPWARWEQIARQHAADRYRRGTGSRK